MPDWAICSEGLTRRFGGVAAVDGIDLRVPRGSVFGFLGPNGAGKTTTIRLLLGLLAPSAGRITVLGRDPIVDGAHVRRRTGVVLEHHGLYEGLSVRASLVFAARAYGLERVDAAARVEQVAERLGLAERLHARPQTLSRGLRQRLAIARALVSRPELLVLDEPTNGLDAESAAALRVELAELVAAGATVFLTTHLLAEAERLCDVVAVVKAGRVVATGAPSALRRGTTVACVRVEGAGIAAVAGRALPGRGWRAEGVDAVVADVDGLAAEPAVVAALVVAGAAVHRVEPVGQTLEAAFLALVGDGAAPAAVPADSAAEPAATAAPAPPAAAALP